MSSHQNKKISSQLEGNAPASGQDYFHIVKNYGGRKQSLPHQQVSNARATKESIKSGEKMKEVIAKKKSLKKKEKGPKKYSAASQQKRQIASRHINRLEKGSEEEKLVSLWKQLWKPQIQQFINAGNYEAAKIFDEEPQQQQFQQCLPEQKREMVLLVPKEDLHLLPKQSSREHGQKNQINHEEFMFNQYLNYQSSLFNQIEQSQDFFFEDIARVNSE